MRCNVVFIVNKVFFYWNQNDQVKPRGKAFPLQFDAFYRTILFVCVYVLTYAKYLAGFITPVVLLKQSYSLRVVSEDNLRQIVWSFA